MKRKSLLLAIAVMLAAGGLWLGRTGWRKDPAGQTGGGANLETERGGHEPGQTHRPPDRNRRFREMTPEDRVKLARQGPIGG